MKRITSFIVGIVAVALGLGALYYVTHSQEEQGGVTKNIQPQSAPAATIVRTASGYEPKEVTVKKGEVVLFRNESGDYHWPASDLHPTHAIYSAFDPLKPVADGQDWAFQFDQVGEWKFHDHIRANKVGTVTVVE